jgi:hypothetical protein
MKTRTSIGEQFFIDIRAVRDGRHDESGIARFPAYRGLWAQVANRAFLIMQKGRPKQSIS